MKLFSPEYNSSCPFKQLCHWQSSCSTYLPCNYCQPVINDKKGREWQINLGEVMSSLLVLETGQRCGTNCASSQLSSPATGITLHDVFELVFAGSHIHSRETTGGCCDNFTAKLQNGDVWQASFFYRYPNAAIIINYRCPGPPSCVTEVTPLWAPYNWETLPSSFLSLMLRGYWEGWRVRHFLLTTLHALFCILILLQEWKMGSSTSEQRRWVKER